ncbi:hypothetical protein JW968_04635 [Candidatus Woesearchaeota archaeon]|nr:hypothetical protein [Candidatus Woesearchaeota archaeon]
MSLKKGEKSLTMIFGLFLLLIISLVVLNLFFRFTEKSTTKMQGASTEYDVRQTQEKAIDNCESLCDNIKDFGSIMDFCMTYHSLDWNRNQIKNDKISEGKWDFCEDKIPCFVLNDRCMTGGTIVDGDKCRTVLMNSESNRKEWYNALAEGGIDDGCGLEDVDSNWKYHFGFNSTI